MNEAIIDWLLEGDVSIQYQTRRDLLDQVIPGLRRRISTEGWDDRMGDALAVLLDKRRSDGRWAVQAPHPGQTHFTMEETRSSSRWNTLIALRVLKEYPTP